jgi:hypothetical protein
MDERTKRILKTNPEIIKLVSDGIDFILIDEPTYDVGIHGDIKYINFNADHGFSGDWFSDAAVYEKIDENGNPVYSLSTDSEDKTANQIATIEYCTLEVSVPSTRKYIELVYSLEIVYEDAPLENRYCYVSQKFMDFRKKRRDLLENFHYLTN